MKRKSGNRDRSKKERKSVKKGGSTYRNKKRIRGGNAFFAPTYNLSYVHPYNAYDLNTYSNVPSLESARNLPAITGGKTKSKYMFKKYKNKTNKMRGGSNIMRGGSNIMRGGLAPLAPDSLNNNQNSAWNSSGSSIINSSPYYMPINVPYGNHNPAYI